MLTAALARPTQKYHVFSVGSVVSNDTLFDNGNSNDELDSFRHYLRVSEFVAMGILEKYLPHHVAMQFGMYTRRARLFVVHFLLPSPICSALSYLDMSVLQ